MDTLFSRYRNAVVLVAALFLQLVLLAFQIKRDKDVPLIRIWAIGVITPVEKLVSGAVRGVYGVWYGYADLRQARQESQGLSEEVSRLKLERHRLLEEAAEARRLRALVQFRDLTPSVTVAARVIGSSASETSRVLFLDRGSESGIRPNMAVITAEGIVGKVHRVFRGTAQVLVITDPDSGVGALLERSRLHGALRGFGGFFCQLRYVANDEKVEPGDQVFTSGEDRIYPKGLPIGVVTSAKTGAVFKEIMVQPFARLNRLEEVLVVTRGVDQEIPAKPEPGPAVAEAPLAEPPPAPVSPGAPASGGRPVADTVAKPKAVPGLEGSRSKPETDADRMQDAYRATQSQKSEAQRALGGLLLPAAGGGVTDMARQPPPTGSNVGAPLAAPRKPPPTSAAPGSAGVPPAQPPPTGSNVGAPLAAPRKPPPTTGATASTAPAVQPQSPPRKAPPTSAVPAGNTGPAQPQSAPRKTQPKPPPSTTGQPPEGAKPQQPAQQKPPGQPPSDSPSPLAWLSPHSALRTPHSALLRTPGGPLK